MGKRIFVSVKSAAFEGEIFEGEVETQIKVLKGCKFYKERNSDDKIVKVVNVLSYDQKKSIFVPYTVGSKIIMLSDDVSDSDISIMGIEINPVYDYLIRHQTCKIDKAFNKIRVGHHVKNNHEYVTVFGSILNGGGEDKIVNSIIEKLWPEDDAKIVDEFLTRVWLGETPKKILVEPKFMQFDFSRFETYYERFGQNGLMDEAFRALQTKLNDAIK